jgi:hypothetical protein
MIKKLLLLAAVVAKLTGVAMFYHSTMAAAEDCTPCPEPCWPGEICES